MKNTLSYIATASQAPTLLYSPHNSVDEAYVATNSVSLPETGDSRLTQVDDPDGKLSLFNYLQTKDAKYLCYLVKLKAACYEPMQEPTPRSLSLVIDREIPAMRMSQMNYVKAASAVTKLPPHPTI